MTRDVGAVVLVLVGGAILRISIGTTYLNYVKESLRPWLLVSGSVLVLLGLLTLLDVWRSGRAAVSETVPEVPELAATSTDRGAPSTPIETAHDHGHDAPRAAWLLVLPVLAVFLIAPPPLGAYTAERQTTSVSAPANGSEVPPLPEGDPVQVSLADYASRAVWDEGRSLVGRTVSLTGFASAAPDGGWYLTRLGLTCCAADAGVTKIAVVDAPYDPPTDAWVTIVGVWVPGGATRSETAIPLVQAGTMSEVPVPENPYE